MRFLIILFMLLASSPSRAEDSLAHRCEIKSNPLVLLIGWFGAEPGYRFSEHWVAGPSFTKYAGSTNSILGGWRGRSIGAFATYFFQPLPESSWYVTSRFTSEKVTFYPGSEASRRTIRERNGTAIELLAGRRVVLSESFFTLFGAGIQRWHYDGVDTYNGVVTRSDDVKTIWLALELKLGWEF